MENNISKILDTVLMRVAFDLTKRNINISYKDHIALELLQEEGSMAYRILTTKLKDGELLQIPARIERLIDIQPQHEELAPDEFLLAYRRHLLEEHISSRNISTSHVLCDIVADTTTATSQVLSQFGINAHTISSLIREASERLEGMQSHIPYYNIFDLNNELPLDEATTTLLEKFGTDLTRLAREGKIDPVIGREAEIDRIVQILARRKKNNPILIGDAGVGKSAIIEGLALRIVTAQVPYSIKEKRIYSLNVAALVAGTKFRGEFEERMQQLIDELSHANDIIIFIDEIHTIVGAGATQGNLDTANILKPALARGHIQTIGATTFDEFREYIESDAALERRFQKVIIEPTTAPQTLEILHNIAPYYEQYHNVKYSPEALQACVSLTDRYISDRHFPDKAIDILDEAGALCRINAYHEPESTRKMEQELYEVTSLRHRAITTRLYHQATTAQIEELALKSRFNEQQTNYNRSLHSNPTLITESHIAHIITAITKIPIERIALGEAERLRSLPNHLNSRIIGQRDAVTRIARAIQRARVGLKESQRPIGVFLLVGPTGVGKTQLAKELSEWMFGNKQGLIRFDMSEYNEKHSIARLVGSPPGYVGYGEGGQLTEAVRRQPYSVVLFDEIEKAHSDIFNAMLQILDEGQLTDGLGRKANFCNTIIILTSNAGSHIAAKGQRQMGYSTRAKQYNTDSTPILEYHKALENTFSPEFLNRIDEIIYFRTLSSDDIKQIIELELEKVLQRIRQQGYKIEITAQAKQRLATMGYESRYGARVLRRRLVDQIESPLSALIIDGKLLAGGCVTIDNDGENGITLLVA